MAKYRNNLPQLSGGPFLTDGGLETVLIFKKGIDLPEFAAFDLLKNDEGVGVLADYFRTYSRIAKNLNMGFILESPTWRANPNWGKKIGYSDQDLDDMNQRSIELLCGVREEFESENFPMVISGQVGPSDDGYNPAEKLDILRAEEYHAQQIGSFAETEADMVAAITMTYAEEAIGISRAAKAAGMPVAISFTVETNGKLPSGRTLKDAIALVDAATENYPAYYMINCAHPTHFDFTLEEDAEWTDRIHGTRVNSSKMSHAELDEAEVLDEGDPLELAQDHNTLRSRLKNLNIVGGCCGTDHRHVEEIGKVFSANRG
ncbi:MAG: homocysteine S-methyltransferase [Pyrinomonadaceae bacterium]|nr:homocysteine S-methyltransferase [Pyrinomonadaceae bacterium]